MIYVIDITSIHRYQGITIDNLIWVSKKKEFSKEGHVTVNFYAFVWFQPYVRGSSDQDVIIDIVSIAQKISNCGVLLYIFIIITF